MAVARYEQDPGNRGFSSAPLRALDGGNISQAARVTPRKDEGNASVEEEIARATVADIRLIDISLLVATNERGETMRDKDGITVIKKREDLIAEMEAASDMSPEEWENRLASYDRALADITYYTIFLSHPSNRQHFDNPPKKPADMLHRWNMPGRYPLVVTNVLGEVIGGVTIADAEADQNDHWITKAVVDPKLQNKKVGFQLLFHAVDWAFSHPDMRGHQRKKLDTSVIMFVKGWERMYAVSRKLGFDPKMVLPDQVKVRLSQKREVVADPEERKEDNPTLRFELEAYKWQHIKGDVFARMHREISALHERNRVVSSK